MKKEELKTKKVKDVISHPLFFENMKNLLDELWEKRSHARTTLIGNLKAHPIDNLVKRDLWEPGEMSLLYAEVLNKTSKEHAATRHFILSCGNEVFNKTMQTLLDEEKEISTNGAD